MIQGKFRLRSDHVEYLSDGTLVEPGELVDAGKHPDDERMLELISLDLLLAMLVEKEEKVKA